MEIRQILLVLIFSALGLPLFAQSKQEKAKAYFFEALDAFEKQEYKSCIENCDKAETLLGEKKAKIESLRIRSNFNLGNYRETQRLLNIFTTLNADDGLKEEVYPIVVRMEEKMQEIKAKEEADRLAAIKAREEAERKAKEEAVRLKREAAIAAEKARQQAIADSIAAIKKAKDDAIDRAKVYSVHQFGVYWVKHEGKYALFNESQQQLTPFKYTSVYQGKDLSLFKDGLATVKYYDKIGMIDPKGEEVVPVDYDAIEPYSHDWFLAKKNGKYGLITKDGNIKVPFQYDFIYPVNNNRIPVGNHNVIGLLNTDGAIIVPVKYQAIAAFGDDNVRLAEVVYNNKHGMIDINGKVVIPIRYDDIVSAPSGGYQTKYVREGNVIVVKSAGKRGLVTVEGKEIIPPQYDGINLKDGMIEIKDGQFNGLMSKDGQLVLPAKFKSIHKQGSIYKVYDGKYFGMYDLTGKELIPVKYEIIYPNAYQENIYIVKDANNHYGAYSKQGQLLIPANYDEIVESSQPLIKVGKNGLYGYYDMNGKMLIPAKYAEIDFILYKDGSFGSDNIAKYKRNGKYGVVDQNGYEILPAEYENIGHEILDISGGAVVVQQNRKLGMVSLQGKIVLPIEYTRISPVKNNGAWIFKDNKFGLIDAHATSILPLAYTAIEKLTGDANWYAVGKGKYTGVWSTREQQFVIPIKYDKIEINRSFIKNSVIVNLYNGDKIGLYDLKREVQIVEPKYDYIGPRDEYLMKHVLVKKNGKIGFMNLDGQEIISVKYDKVVKLGQQKKAVMVYKGNKGKEVVIP